MVFDAGTWWLIGILLTVLLGVIGALISRSVFGRLDENSKDIKQIQKEYTPRTDHQRDIKDVREELRGETRKLSADIEDIKENCARNVDMIRLVTGLERKVDKVMEYLMAGGSRNG